MALPRRATLIPINEGPFLGRAMLAQMGFASPQRARRVAQRRGSELRPLIALGTTPR